MFNLGVALLVLPYRALYPLPGPVYGDGLALNIHFTSADPRRLERIWNAGFRWLRVDLDWATTERRPGRFDFSAKAALIRAATGRGFRLIFVLGYRHPSYGGADWPERFSAFAAAATRRYGGRGHVWEVWNEPNDRTFWREGPDPHAYLRLLRATTHAIRGVHREEWIMAPGLAGIDYRYLDKLLQGELAKLVDIVSVHPYRGTSPFTVLRDADRLRARLKWARPDSPPALAFSEWGYGVEFHVPDAATQGRFVPQIPIAAMAAGAVFAVVYAYDDAGPDAPIAQRGFGIVAHDERPKPAYEELVRQRRALLGARWIGREGDALVFRRGSEQFRIRIR